MITVIHDDWVLYHENGTPVTVGEIAKDFRGNEATITGGRSPASASSTGRVWVINNAGVRAEFFPSVFNMVWKHIPATTKIQWETAQHSTNKSARTAQYKGHQLYVRRAAPRSRTFIVRIDGQSCCGGYDTIDAACSAAAVEARRRFTEEK